jgi:phage terminase large subunit-like protein
VLVESPPSLGGLVSEFTETFVTHTRGEYAGQLVDLRPWQKQILNGLFELDEHGLWKHRQGLIILPRKSGKSLLLSGVACWGLFASQEPGAEIYCVAASKDQARIVFGNIKDTIEADPDLSAAADVYKDAISVPSTGAVCRVLSSDGALAHGLSPVVSIVDETWAHKDGELYEALLSGSGARRQSLLVHITTAGAGEGTPLARLVEYDRRVKANELEDPTWFSYWNPPPPDADYTNPKTWAAAHPAYGDWITESYLTSQLKQLPAPEFKRLHLASWIANRDVWLEPHQLERIGTCEPLTSDDFPVLAVDGSWSNDASAVVAATADGRIELLHIQEKPIDGDEGYRINVPELLAAVVFHAERLMARGILYDRYLIGPAMLGLGDDGLNVVEFPQTARRMVPASKRMADAILDGNLKIVDNEMRPQLLRHIENCRLKVDRLGARIVKDHSSSARKIDAAVCAVMAFDAANELPLPITITPRIH